MAKLQVGDTVVAIRDGGHDRKGLPLARPQAGKVYKITSIYPMSYGLGCTLQGMDPSPYRGYLLHVSKAGGTMRRGWYFKKLQDGAADAEFTTALYDLIRSKDHVHSGR